MEGIWALSSNPSPPALPRVSCPEFSMSGDGVLVISEENFHALVEAAGREHRLES